MPLVDLKIIKHFITRNLGPYATLFVVPPESLNFDFCRVEISFLKVFLSYLAELLIEIKNKLV